MKMVMVLERHDHTTRYALEKQKASPESTRIDSAITIPKQALIKFCTQKGWGGALWDVITLK